MWHFIAYALGITDANSPTYLLWSGFFPDVTVFGGGFLILRHHNCAVPGCLRVGKIHQDHKCKKHHEAP